MSRLTLHLLGPFQASIDGEPLAGFDSDKVRALLAYLAVEVDLPHPREKLAGLLWPDFTERSARTNLRRALSNLRQVIRDREADPPFLLITRQTIQFNVQSDHKVDVSAFAAVMADSPDLSLDALKLEDAVSLYRGNFLEGFSLPDSAAFEEWLLITRESLQQQVIRALKRLSSHYEGSGAFDQALIAARRQLTLDPYQEAAHRQTMRILALSGQRNEALAQYENCRRILSDEMGIEPSRKTTALFERIRADDLERDEIQVQEKAIRGYKLRELIGAGHYGAIYRAYQPVVGREVAVKVIHPKYANQPDFIRRFEGEAQIVARLEHPHIVPLYDYWREPSGAYLVMRYLRGGNLRLALESDSWSPKESSRMLDQLSRALALAHRQGVIHRDVKPENILLDEEENVYLTDFGIAKDLLQSHGQTATGAIIGTFSYVSPEQAQSKSITPASDLYSLGVVAYEMLVGEHPFPGETPTGQLILHVNEPLPSLQIQRPDLPAELDSVIQQATSKEPDQRFPDAFAFASAFKTAVFGSKVSVPAPDLFEIELVNPYKGLRPFEEADAADFFGRDDLIEQLLDRMATDEPFGRFLAVVGPSGSGKSSVVKAGTVPAVRAGALPNSDSWFVVEMVPSAHPLDELEISLLRVAAKQPPDLMARLQRDDRGLVRSARLILPDDDSQLLLVVDQFEELFTHTVAEDDREHFLGLLYGAVTEPRTRVRVLVTLRADFYDRPLMEPNFSQLMKARTEVVVPMLAEELGRAIAEPARQAGAQVEPELLGQMVADISEQPGALPMLQYALTELFERRDGRNLTLSAYQAIGGVTGAIAQRAEEIYTALDTPGQLASRQLLLRLVTLGEGTEDTRRRVRRSELESMQTADGRPTTTDQQPITIVLDTFGTSRLLTFDRDPATREPTVEVAHEALIREWRRLRDWLDDSRDELRQHRKLTAAAAEWALAGRDQGFLLRGTPLDQFELWSETTDLALTADEQSYLQASLEERVVRLQAEAERQAHEVELERRSRNRLRALVGVFAVAAVIAVVLTIFAFGQRIAAEQNEALAIQGQATATVAQGEALFQASTAEAERARAEEEALARATQQVLAEEQADARATAQAEAEEQRSLAEEQRAVAEQQQIIAEEQKAVAEIEARAALEAYSQSLAAHVDNALEGKDSATALALALEASLLDDPPALTQRMLRQAAYAPGPRQQFLVAETFPGVEGRVFSLAMSPNESVALIGFEDGSLILWNVETETEIHRLEGHDGIVRTVAFSPDGQTALSGGSDQAVILWDLGTGQEIRRFEGHDGWVRTVYFSPNGLKAVSGGFVGDSASSVPNPGQLILWDLASGGEIRRFGGESGGHPSGVVAAAFTPDGRVIMASSGFFANVDHEYSLMLWDAETGQKIRDFEITGQFDNFSLAISPDGHTALTGTNLGEVLLWDMDTGKQILTLEGHTGNMVTSIAYSPDGRRALSGDANGLVILWDLDSGEHVMRTGVQEPNMGGWHAEDKPVLNLSISPDGRAALSSAGDGTLMLWDLVDAGEIRRFKGHQVPGILGVAFTPDGNHVLTGEWGDAFGFFYGDSNSLRLWDVETGEELRSFEGHTEGILMIAVSADGRQALTGSQDGTMRLWDLETGEEIRQILAHSGGVFAVAISPDGRFALSGSMADDLTDSGISLWDLESGQIIRRLTDQHHFTTLVFGPDGQTAYGQVKDDDETYRSLGKYDIGTGLPVRQYSTPPCCTGFAIHPNGRSVFLADNYGGPVIEWDLDEDREIRAFGQYPGSRTRVEVGPDGRLLLVSTVNLEGGILSLWDLETGQEIRRFSGDGICCFDIDMSPDGRMAITPGGGGTAILWDLSLPVDMDEVRDWIDHNRYVRELSCEERDLYRIEPLCEG